MVENVICLRSRCVHWDDGECSLDFIKVDSRGCLEYEKKEAEKDELH